MFASFRRIASYTLDMSFSGSWSSHALPMSIWQIFTLLKAWITAVALMHNGGMASS